MKKLLLLCTMAVVMAACKKDEEPTHTYTVKSTYYQFDSSGSRYMEINIDKQIYYVQALPVIKRVSGGIISGDSTIYFTYSYTGTYPAYVRAKLSYLNKYYEKWKIEYLEDGIIIQSDSAEAINAPLSAPTFEFYKENKDR